MLISPELFISTILPDSDLNDLIHDALKGDKSVMKILERLEDRERVKGWSTDNGLLYYHECIYVLNVPEIHKAVLESHHDNPAAGHPGQFRTYELPTHHYYWSSTKQAVPNYISSHDSCICSKTRVQLGYCNPLKFLINPGGR